MNGLLDICIGMDTSRTEQALQRIEAAFARIAAASEAASRGPAAPSAKVIELINTHEKLREDVADTMREIDTLIEQLEG